MRPPDVDKDDWEADDMRGNSRWKLDRHVPVATIISLGLFVLTQTAVLSYGWATMTGRIEVLERQTNSSAAAVVATATASSSLSERLVKLETKFDGAIESLTEIKALLRQVPTRQSP